MRQEAETTAEAAADNGDQAEGDEADFTRSPTPTPADVGATAVEEQTEKQDTVELDVEKKPMELQSRAKAFAHAAYRDFETNTHADNYTNL